MQAQLQRVIKVPLSAIISRVFLRPFDLTEKRRATRNQNATLRRNLSMRFHVAPALPLLSSAGKTTRITSYERFSHRATDIPAFVDATPYETTNLQRIARREYLFPSFRNLAPFVRVRRVHLLSIFVKSINQKEDLICSPRVILQKKNAATNTLKKIFKLETRTIVSR